MRPLLFGPASRRLFGLFHPPLSRRSNAPAVLICPPFGQEAIRSRRLFRVLADRLAGIGVPVLRFDYYGTGDSPGDDNDGELHGWRGDLCTAHDELRRRSGARRVVWLGARLGGTLAVLATGAGHCHPERLLLWDPIVAGPAYLKQMRERHLDALERASIAPDPSWRRQLARNPDAFTEETLGFTLSAALLRQLRALVPDTLHISGRQQTEVLAPPDDSVVQRWCLREVSRGVPLRWTPFTNPARWTAEPTPHGALAPAEALDRLQQALA